MLDQVRWQGRELLSRELPRPLCFWPRCPWIERVAGLWCMAEREPTDNERSFWHAISRRVEGLLDWYLADDDGTPWMIVSLDLGAVLGTMRCDWDGARLVGGRSPAYLNWDAETRADAAGVVSTPPDGVDVLITDPELAADIAAAWFENHIARADRR